MNKQNSTKKLYSMRKLLSYLTVFTLLFSLSGCSKKTPREALEESFQKTFVTDSPAEILLGLTDINQKTKEDGAYSTGYSLTLQQLSGENVNQYSGLLSGLGITVDTASDLANRKSSGTIDITYGGTTYLTLGGQLQGSKFHITSPQLLHGSLMVNFATLKDDLNSDSMMAGIFREAGVTLPDSLFSDLVTSFANPSSLMNLGKFTQALETFDESIVVEKRNKKEVSLPEGTSAKNVYLVTIPEEAYVDVITASLDSYMDYLASVLTSLGEYEDSELETDKTEAKEAVKEFGSAVGDIPITVAVTKNGYISYAESEFASETERFSFSATFSGEKNPLKESELVVHISDEKETVKFQYESSFDTEKNTLALSADMKLDQEPLLSLSCEGEFKDVEKGSKYTLDFDYIELQLADELSVSLAGDYYVDTTKCDISDPTGTAYNLFAMSEDDFGTLVMEVLLNIQNDPLLSGLLGELDLGI